MTRHPLSIYLPAIVSTAVALAAIPPGASAQDDDLIQVGISSGTIMHSGDSAQLRLEIENGTSTTIRLIHLSADYDTPSGATLTFTSPPDMDIRVGPGQGHAEELTFSTQFAEGESVDWARPYTMQTVMGADIEGLREHVAAVGDDIEEVQTSLREVSRFQHVLASAVQHHAERVDRLLDRDRWFDFQAVSALKPDLEAALCEIYGNRVRRAGGAQDRVDAYHAAHAQLLQYNLYGDCVGPETRRLVARSMVSIGRPQDALVLVERDDAGEIPEDWREIYIAGRLALAESAIAGVDIRQLQTGVESLNEVLIRDPENRELEGLVNRLMLAAANHVEAIIAEQQEMDALELTRAMRAHFRDHPEVQRASEAAARGVIAYGVREADANHPVGANNAFVLGNEMFAGMDVWENNVHQLHNARRDYYTRQAEAALEAGELEGAEEALTDASDRRLDIVPEVRDRILNEVLLRRWSGVDELIAQEQYAAAYGLAAELEDSTPHVAVLGDRLAATYMTIAEGVWDKYGYLGGAFAGGSLDVAEQAIARGRSADPERADALLFKIGLSRWMLPVVLGALLVIAALVVVLRGSWRKRLKARSMWKTGLKSVQRGDLHKGAELLDKAYNLIGLDDRAAGYVGEESRGHMVLRIAEAYKREGRDDEVRLWSGEWQVLGDYERPFAKGFEEALEAYSQEAGG